MLRMNWLGLLLMGAAMYGCASVDGASYGSPGGDFGATPGGAQDMTYARSVVMEGMVPPPEAFTVEGMFSEHDLPLDGPPCVELFCLRTALGRSTMANGVETGWMQVGLSSTVNPDEYVRASLTLVLVVDVSGSMGWDYDEESPGELARSLLHEIAYELDASDRVAIVTFGSNVDTPLGFVDGSSQAQIHGAIDDLATNGSTNLEAGLQRGYELAAGVHATDEVRVMLFSDYQPNTGATSPSQFDQMVTGAAAEGVGTTIFALGLGLGAEFMTAMSHQRGGNAFSIIDTPGVTALMDDSWPWMVSPIAYDLSISLKPDVGFTLAEGYGFPAIEPDEARLEVASVFLSRRKGALLMRLAPDPMVDLWSLGVTGSISYVSPEGVDFSQPISDTLTMGALDENGAYFEEDSVAATVALAELVSAMKRAAGDYASDPASAAQDLGAAVDHFEAAILPLGDADLDAELSFGRALLTLMQNGASQESFYGGF